MVFWRVGFSALGVLFAAGVVLAAGTWHSALPSVDATSSRFPADVVQRGATLAAIGNCASCHSAPGQPPYSGGVSLETPFGTVYSTNITPDRETGLGRWSEQAFIRAMREGVDREGRRLYPAFPYDHFTLVSDDDDRALYAFLMTRLAVASKPKPNTLIFPLNIRTTVTGWNLLYLRQGPYRPDPSHDAVWNRGAYLVEGLGHCGACHTPRNALGAERSERHLAGGVAEGWNAYALDRSSPAPIAWTVDTLAFYLQHGWEQKHGVSRGPMAVVTANLGNVPESEARAMATYLVSIMDRPTQEPAGDTGTRPIQPAPAPSAGSQIAVSANAADGGATLYAGACASCHDSGRPVPYGGLSLGLSSAFHAPDPSNIVTVTLHGLPAPSGAAGAVMPGFEGSLDDRQIAALLAYVRAEKAHEAPWPDLEAKVREARSRAITLYASDGTDAAPADTDLRIAR